MKLLTPEKLKEDADARVAERQRRNKAAMDEEKQILDRLNAAHDEEDRQRILKELGVAEEVTAQEKYLADLKDEVAGLESRKAQALVPITDREEAITAREEKCADIEDKQRVRGNELDRGETELLDRTERLADAEDNLTERTEAVRAREIGVEKAENENKRQASSIAEEWRKINEAVINQKNFHEGKEAENDAKYKANQIKFEEIQLKEFDLIRREDALTDKYKTFVASAEEWQNTHPDAPDLMENVIEKNHD